MQGAQLFPDQPPAAVGPVRLDLDAGAGLKAHLRVGLRIDRAQHPNPAGERRIGAHIAELSDLPIQRRGPQLGMGAEPAGDVGRLRLGEFRRPGPRSVPRHGLRRRIPAGGPPADIELPGNPRDRPPMPLVQRVHHGPVLLTLHPSLLPGSRLRHRNRRRRDRPFLGADKAPGTTRGLCTLRDQDSAYFVITNRAGEVLHQPSQLGQPQAPLARQVAQVGEAGEGRMWCSQTDLNGIPLASTI